MKLFPCATLNDEQMQQYLQPDELKMLSKRRSKKSIEALPRHPVRLTLNGLGEILDITRTEKEVSALTVGKNAEFKEDGSVTFDALLCFVAAGDLIPGRGQALRPAAYVFQLPFSRDADITGSVHENFRLRYTYLPLQLEPGSDALLKYEPMRDVVAEIDVATQSVLSMELFGENDGVPPYGTLADDSTPGRISVIGFLANGGCNFSCVIR